MRDLIRYALTGLVLGTGSAGAQAPETSLVPVPRPGAEAAPEPDPIAASGTISVTPVPDIPASTEAPRPAHLTVELDGEAAAEPAPEPVADTADPAPEPQTEDVAEEVAATRTPDPPSDLAVLRSPRPRLRGDVPPDFAARAAVLRAEAEAAALERLASDRAFRDWIVAFQTRARAAGIDQVTLDRAFDGVELDQQVLELDRNQAEFSRALWEYLDTAVSDTRVRNGRARAAEFAETLAEIEARYQVEAEVVVAIWGLESAYGAARGGTDVIAAMATLAYEGRRQDFFEAQLIAALQILESGDTRPRNMVGSWAGAMGHTQFMPTSYLEYAQDFTGDGRRNIWGDDPVDALASTAHYLAEHGWVYGQPWGMEVRLPDDFSYAIAGEQERLPARFWNSIGVRLVNGDPIPEHGPCSILLPAGAAGVPLVVFSNFRVIERYNPADAYVIAVGHLSDRITGGPAFQAGWPRGDRALTFAEREELQRYLQARGFYLDDIDGIVGPRTIAAVRAYQTDIGVVPDGYASPRLLDRLRDS